MRQEVLLFHLWIHILQIEHEKSVKLILNVKTEMQIEIERLIHTEQWLVIVLLVDRETSLKNNMESAQRLHRYLIKTAEFCIIKQGKNWH